MGFLVIFYPEVFPFQVSWIHQLVICASSQVHGVMFPIYNHKLVQYAIVCNEDRQDALILDHKI